MKKEFSAVKVKKLPYLLLAGKITYIFDDKKKLYLEKMFLLKVPGAFTFASNTKVIV